MNPFDIAYWETHSHTIPNGFIYYVMYSNSFVFIERCANNFFVIFLFNEGYNMDY